MPSSVSNDTSGSSNLSSRRGDAYSYSGSTAPTEYSSEVHYLTKTVEPPAYLCRQDPYAYERYPRYEDRAPPSRHQPDASADTYESTVPSDDEELDDGYPDYGLPDDMSNLRLAPQAEAATPKAFGELFPSSRPISIRHDDTTMDGNMNLRLDTEVISPRGDSNWVTLFHLRMHDLKDRDFSFRRYCRDSGREVCNSRRKYKNEQKHTQTEPSADFDSEEESLTTAFASLRRNNTDPLDGSQLNRQDSGYGSVRGSSDEQQRPRTATRTYTDLPPAREPTNTIKLEFSNYAHVNVKRHGKANHKHYDFEYWGIHYSWRRILPKDSHVQHPSWSLTRVNSDRPLAHIVPASLTPSETAEETCKGGWVPPSTFWISDPAVINNGMKDLSDVLLAAGLIAMVDDTIKTRFHSKWHTQLVLPLSRNSSFKIPVDNMTPKRLIDEVFHRGHRSELHIPLERPAHSRRGSHRT
ncbi:hypothetical protein BDY21DRAFT_290160 [Lineolata rhizophorae]|uniref:Uncharacterized protein n=1 Tax=Lineolata rhizophorae TaxID=578093 RepID=A0A6A6NTQ5_9PEZI|nr:hypothetical protein BDY21DRAFT_290160 [Lineolata rhizophorae]